MNLQESIRAWEAHAPLLASHGIVLPHVRSYLPDGFAGNYPMALDAMMRDGADLLAMDAQAPLTTSPNAGLPVILTTFIDPTILQVMFAALKAVEILGEVQKGSWVDDTAMFPVVEHGGETSSYGDFAESGVAQVNFDFENRQQYLFQTLIEYGVRESERAGLARISWVTEKEKSAAARLQFFRNYTYFFGVAGLQNYGLINDPSLSAALTPSTKAAGGTGWITNGAITATANEIWGDIQSLLIELISQSNGLITKESKLVLSLSPASAFALTATNSFNVNVYDLIKKNLENLRVVEAVQYGALSATDPQGNAAGNIAQMICEEVEGQQTGYCAFSEKMRAGPIIRATSSFKQKRWAGSWGAIIRQPFAVASMVGI